MPSNSFEITSWGFTTPARVQAMARLGVGRMRFFADGICSLPALARRAGDAVATL